MLEFVILADDLSGACDTAVQFNNFGYKTLVLPKLPDFKNINSKYNVLAITTNSREIEITKAKEKVSKACQFVKKLKNIKIYKKIDSTWRGNIGAEMETIIQELGLSFGLICSAYPANKRIGLGGYLLVDGQLLQQTAMAKDPGSPIQQGYLPDLLAKQTQLPVAHIGLQTLERGRKVVKQLIKEKITKGPCIFIADAVEQKHLDALAQIVNQIEEPHILAGSAGLSAAILRPQRKKNEAISPPILTIVGSANPNNLLQVEELLKKNGVREIYVPGERFLNSNDNSIERLLIQARELLANGNDLVVRTCQSAIDVEYAKAKGMKLGLDSKEVAHKIAQGLQNFIAGIVTQTQIAGMIITGGATLLQILEVIDGGGIEVNREIEPGVPLGYIVGGKLSGLPVITKAGGFGSPKVFYHGLEILKEEYIKKGEVEIE